MRIGFDAKRAFFNRSGLGNYSRQTITILSNYFSLNEYFLYTPKPQKSVSFHKAINLRIKGPQKFIHRKFSSFWRSYRLTEQLVLDKIDLYHGLSNELPKEIENTRIPTIVTIHDIIFRRYPKFYKSVDRKIYEEKFKYSVNNASRIIAVSNQTKKDITEFFGISEDKIDVVYQGCNPVFWNPLDKEDRLEILMKYLIPENYILYVGTIEERKNLLNILKALQQDKINYPLVVIGKQTSYYNKVMAYVKFHGMKNIFFLHHVPNDDLPAFYQQAKLFVYPSLFEGFGIPILEALTSKTPVITSCGGCFSEAGGSSSLYVDPENVDELAHAIKKVIEDSTLRDNMIIDGFVHAQQFRLDKIAGEIMAVYQKVF